MEIQGNLLRTRIAAALISRMSGACLTGALLLTSGTWASAVSEKSPTCPSLSLVEEVLFTTAKLDFSGRDQSFEAAVRWTWEGLRNSQDGLHAPYLACAEYGEGREALSRLRSFLSPEAVGPVSHSSTHGTCFIATASYTQAAVISKYPAEFNLARVGPFPSALKIAPGLLEFQDSSSSEADSVPGRLTTTHGSSMRLNNVQGLTVELSPGTLAAHDAVASDAYISGLLQDLMSDSMDLHAGNFWSDPAILDGEHLTTSGGALREVEWSRAATVVHELSTSGMTSPGDICLWGNVAMHHVVGSSNVILISGLDHLLPSGRGAGGQQEEAAELHVACCMGLLSFLAGRPEILRVDSWHRQSLLNAAARANIQSATVTSTPLTDAGLDGTGEVIQIIDTGLDETSCFFEDGDGQKVPHGHIFYEVGVLPLPLTSILEPGYSVKETISDGRDFSAYPERRKIIQYIDLIKSDPEDGAFGSSFSTEEGGQFPWLPANDFGEDEAAGHGTHTAGSAAGATLNVPAEPVSCTPPKVLSCAGGCIDDDATRSDDDLVSAYNQANLTIDIDRLCPLFTCDDEVDEHCLSSDVSRTLTENGGVAQGAKLAIVDVFFGKSAMSDAAGNDLWEPCSDAGCKLHSNSLGADLECSHGANDLLYDKFMYENPENLLLFAAGNEGDINDGRTVCTIRSPAIAKNVLAIGATSSGETRLSSTPGSNIDTVAGLSSYGPTKDGRIKPELVAPGDMIYSAASDGTDQHSCRLWAFSGTSMSCPIVAGAAAMIRQYFVDSSFYAADVTARGFCDDGFICEGFSPSSATIKALLINSANLMGGSSEPDGFRGFGRVHLEAGMPLNGEESLVLFVADAARTSIPELSKQEYLFDVDGESGLDFRVTLSWIDQPANSASVKQLVHDLDLTVISPSGERHVMLSSGEMDTANVNERVIVDAVDVESGTWTVWVWANSLITNLQSYSLVVNGAVSPGTGEAAATGESSSPVPSPSSTIGHEEETSTSSPTGPGR